jgi:putative transposase
MKKKRFKEEQIVKILKKYEGGREIKDLCRELGVTPSTFYNWRKKYKGMETIQLKRLKVLETENRKLKQMYADASLDIIALKVVISNLPTCCEQAGKW